MLKFILLLPKYYGDHVLQLLFIRCLWRVEHGYIREYAYQFDLGLAKVQIDNWEGRRVVNVDYRFTLLLFFLFYVLFFSERA